MCFQLKEKTAELQKYLGLGPEVCPIDNCGFKSNGHNGHLNFLSHVGINHFGVLNTLCQHFEVIGEERSKTILQQLCIQLTGDLFYVKSTFSRFSGFFWEIYGNFG